MNSKGPAENANNKAYGHGMCMAPSSTSALPGLVVVFPNTALPGPHHVVWPQLKIKIEAWEEQGVSLKGLRGNNKHGWTVLLCISFVFTLQSTRYSFSGRREEKAQWPHNILLLFCFVFCLDTTFGSAQKLLFVGYLGLFLRDVQWIMCEQQSYKFFSD